MQTNDKLVTRYYRLCQYDSIIGRILNIQISTIECDDYVSSMLTTVITLMLVSRS